MKEFIFYVLDNLDIQSQSPNLDTSCHLTCTCRHCSLHVYSSISYCTKWDKRQNFQWMLEGCNGDRPRPPLLGRHPHSWWPPVRELCGRHDTRRGPAPRASPRPWWRLTVRRSALAAASAHAQTRAAASCHAASQAAAGDLRARWAVLCWNVSSSWNMTYCSFNCILPFWHRLLHPTHVIDKLCGVAGKHNHVNN